MKDELAKKIHSKKKHFAMMHLCGQISKRFGLDFEIDQRRRDMKMELATYKISHRKSVILFCSEKVVGFGKRENGNQISITVQYDIKDIEKVYDLVKKYRMSVENYRRYLSDNDKVIGKWINAVKVFPEYIQKQTWIER